VQVQRGGCAARGGLRGALRGMNTHLDDVLHSRHVHLVAGVCERNSHHLRKAPSPSQYRYPSACRGQP